MRSNTAEILTWVLNTADHPIRQRQGKNRQRRRRKRDPRIGRVRHAYPDEIVHTKFCMSAELLTLARMTT